jgi:nitroreductase
VPLIIENSVLESIRARRNIVRFSGEPVDEEKVETILEAGRWAPSWLNKQPWRFLVITDKNVKEKLSQAVPTVFGRSLREAPLCIAIVVDPKEDPYHYVEAGAIATQNMALAAQSIGLNTGWVGVFDIENRKKSSEQVVKQILGIPKNYRVISLLPIGHTDMEVTKPDRKRMEQLVLREFWT